MVRKSSSKRGCQISRFKLLSLLDSVPPEAQVLQTESLTPEKNPDSPSDRVYLHAAAIFQNAHLDKPAAHRLISYGKRSEVSVPVALRDESSQRLAYRLAFNTLKYQELLEDVLIDSCFCLSQPMVDDWMSLVAVIFTDLLDRKFLPRIQQQEEVHEVREVEACLLRFKTKLVASLARCRIKHELLTLNNILPDDIRHKQDKASRLPLYAWVNTLRTSVEEDKSCCVGPWALRPLLAKGADVLMVGCLSAQTIAHVSAVAASAHTHTDTHTAAQSDHHNTVFVCLGDQTLSHRDEIQRIVIKLVCKNVKLLSDSLHSLDVSLVYLQKVHVIFLMPVCSLSAVSNTVDYILQENADSELMLDLSQGSISPSKLKSLICQQRRDLQRAFLFPQVCAVLYSTCSVYSEENEELLNKVLTESQNSTVPPYRFTAPGLLQDSEEMKFFRLESSDEGNGCFVALLTRQCEAEVTETPQDVLARAAAKGLLDGILPNQPIKKQRRGRRSRKAPAKQIRFRQPRPQASQSDQSRIEEFLQREMRGCSSQTSVTISRSSHPSFSDNPAASQHPTPCVLPGTGSTPNPATSSSLANRSLKWSGAAAVSIKSHLSSASVAPPRGRQEVLRPATITFPPVVFPLPLRRSHTLRMVRSDISIGP